VHPVYGGTEDPEGSTRCLEGGQLKVIGEIVGANPVEILRRVAIPRIEQAGRKVTRVVAARYAGQVRQAILGQEFEDDWEPLSPKYLRWKVRMGLDERLLRATGEYVQSIQVRLGEEDGVYIVSPADRSHRDPRVARPDGPSLKQIGFWLEYGTFKVVQLEDGNVGARVLMPARPHWRPVWTRFKSDLDRHRQEVRDRVWQEIRPYLQQDLEEALEAVGTVEIRP
jgi:hypothetical protein